MLEPCIWVRCQCLFVTVRSSFWYAELPLSLSIIVKLRRDRSLFPSNKIEPAFVTRVRLVS